MTRAQERTSLATLICRQVAEFDLSSIDRRSLDHVKTILVDSIACIYAAGPEDETQARLARILCAAETAPEATVIASGRQAGIQAAVLANGADLRSRDLMDVYAGSDVTHPSEIVPTVLALAEATDAGGRAALTALACGLALHVAMSRALPLHPFRLHHTGHAAFVVPAIAARLKGSSRTTAETAVNLAAPGLFVPEGFSRGHVTNLKTYGYGLKALHALQMLDLAEAGLAAGDRVADEVVEIWSKLGGGRFDRALFDGPLDAGLVWAISLKQFPAQYALQPLIAAAISLRARHEFSPDQVTAIRVTASGRTIDRCADAAKFAITSPETADHSLPFCVAAALADGRFDTLSLERRRWEDAVISRLMSLVEPHPAQAGGLDYEVGPQEIVVQLRDGRALSTACPYPDGGTTWRMIAIEKLRRHAPAAIDAAAILDGIDRLEHAPSIRPLLRLFRAAAD